MTVTSSYSIISLASAFRIIQGHYLFKKKRKEKNELLSVSNKVGCRIVFTHPPKRLMYQSND